jgi:hypothetical protein
VGFKRSDLFVGNTMGVFFFLVLRLSFCMALYTLTFGATDPKQVYAGLGSREG